MAKIPERRNPQTRLTYWENQHIAKQSYSQLWHEYNLSQTSEKLMFMDMLHDLCSLIETKEAPKRGRRALNVREILYCMAHLVYEGKSSRRTISELHLAKEKGYLNKVPHFNTILNYFNNPAMKEHLRYLITISSLPLRLVEKDFTVDSTGYTTSVFGRWFDHKFGKQVDHRLWRKAHVMSGVKTNIITAIEVNKGTSSDTMMFPELVDKTSENFTMREVSGDMAYSSRDNVQLVSDKGAVAYIPFRRHATGKARGSMVWSRMFQYFNDYYDEFMIHYHKRSNAESVFSMIKRKFGSNLRTKKEPAQDNEIICKALCHNIVVLVHEIFELGIETEFETIAKTVKTPLAQ